ncbi:MAG: hypothetical protein AB1782_11975 [Cyanobacteriota bacterium]
MFINTVSSKKTIPPVLKANSANKPEKQITFSGHFELPFYSKKINALNFNKIMLTDFFSRKSLSAIEDRKAKYPKDHEYRTELAKHVGCPPEALMSVVGKEELLDILSKLTPENFAVGKNNKNIKNGTFKANMHIHTLDSDGSMKVEDLLNQAVKYANSMPKPPFIFSITNHDILNDTRNAIEIIAKTPEKYKNILFIPGIEMTAKYMNPELFDKPIQIEMLGYCINPYDKKINDFLENTRQNNFKYADFLIKEAKKIGLETNLDELKSYYKLLEIGASPAFIYLTKEFMLEKAFKKNIDPKLVLNIFEEHEKKYGTIFVSPATPDIETLLSTFDKSLLSLAHPGRIHLNGIKKGVSGKIGMNSLFDRLVAHGGIAAEINYQYPDSYYNDESNAWLKHIREYAESLNIVNTGGIDNHGSTIFKNH